MSVFDDVVVDEPRPLPVILLVDVSGSMAQNGKIEACNQAVADMIASLAEETDTVGDITLGVITFGGDRAEVFRPVAPVGSMAWADMSADGRTPLGHALSLTQEWLEDEDVVPRRAFKPTVVLISDGKPTDEWDGPLRDLLGSRRGGRSLRMAVSIQSEPGDDSYDVLVKFAGDPDRVMAVRDAAGIAQALEWVTLSVTQRAITGRDDIPALPQAPNLNDL